MALILSDYCLTDIIHPPPMYDFPFPSPRVLKKLGPITAADIENAINRSQFSVSTLKRLEDNIGGPDPGSAGQGLTIYGLPSMEAMEYNKLSLIITKATQNLLWNKCSW